ncbi:Na(+)/H(+) antiporter subunit B [Alkalihalobacillus trypoxylicola]|uniref:Cation:proton antiporter n=1 Tax=Alkalihalobacillus trypoxylicola TaxID=519424 RepID=A0A162EPB6_9BACI|nr:Na(+)/H(+) antiporter subunit B [Alkalihalobacillus trypoxylicola]KYG33402.1 cation:proton antiporter [Alkalihalobacillus trypoxylicola]
MRKIETNDVMLRTITRIVVLIILIFSVYLFFAGHNNPGGGFIGGLMTASALLLMYLVFNIQTIKSVINIKFEAVIGIGLIVTILTGVIGVFNGDAYLTQYFDYFQIPIFGETELATALPFDLGIYLVVVGIALTIILAIAEDDA